MIPTDISSGQARTHRGLNDRAVCPVITRCLWGRCRARAGAGCRVTMRFMAGSGPGWVWGIFLGALRPRAASAQLGRPRLGGRLVDPLAANLLWLHECGTG